MRNLLREFEIQKARFDGFYRARVEDNNDKLKLGRIKIRIYPHFEDIAVDDLPWAEPCWWMPMQIPPVGSWVWVFFENGDPLKPVYMGQAIPLGVDKPLEPFEKVIGNDAKKQHMYPKVWFDETGSHYPNSYLIRSPNGHLIKIDDQTGEIDMYSNTGNRILLQPDGTIEIYSTTKSKLIMRSDGDVILQSAKDLYLKPGRNIYLEDSTEAESESNWYEE